MSIFEENFLLRIFKKILKKTVYKSGSVVTILRGPLRGYRYIVNDNSGWAPIYGGWESCAEKIYSHLVKKGDVVYDLGANTGLTSLLFSKLVGDSGKVFAFEPLPENIKEMESLRKLNDITNLYLINKAISNTSGVALFNLGKHNKSGSLTRIGKESGEAIEVNLTTLDEAIKDGLEPPDFIKMDIEGTESEALEGFSQSIKDYYPAFLIESHIQKQDARVGSFFKRHGYRLYRLKDAFSIRVNKQRQILLEIPNIESGWPDPEGVWGTVVAIHSHKQEQSYYFHK